MQVDYKLILLKQEKTDMDNNLELKEVGNAQVHKVITRIILRGQKMTVSIVSRKTEFVFGFSC